MTLDFMDNASFKYFTDHERYERDEISAFLSCVAHNPGSYIIDVGAHYGAYTLSSATLANLNVFEKIIALEPDRRAHGALCKSIDANHFGDAVQLFQVIASDRKGDETLYVNARSSADNRTHRITTAPIKIRSEYRVPCVKIDTLLGDLSVPKASKFIVKMDIQGNEPRALAGMRETLMQAEGFILFFEYSPYLMESAGIVPDDFTEFLRGLQLDLMFEINNEIVRLDRFDDLAESFRTLAAKKESQMQGAAGNYIVGKKMIPGWCYDVAG
jgi:FkbM family methyltransferase